MEAARPRHAEEAAALARGAVDCLPAGALEARLAQAEQEGRPLRVKLGIDPTAPDIHLGHTVVLSRLRRFQDAGHRVVLIVGDYTARIGDPSGRSATRPVLSGEEIDRNAATFATQAAAVLDQDPERLEVVRNGEWLDMRVEELFALARTTTVAQVLERDDFAKRQAAGEPISILELLYPLLQAYDSVAVRADVELGGTDQKFNLLLGREVQRAYGVPEQVVMTLPILPGTDGERRMSKSLGNYVGVTEPPEEMYGKTLRVPDSALATWRELLLDARRRRRRGRATPSARWPASWSSRASTARGGRRRPSAHFDRVHVEHRPPEEVEEAVFRAPTAPAPAGRAGRRVRPVDVGGAAAGRAGWRAPGWPGAGRGDLDIAADRLDGALLQVGKRRFRRLRRG